MPGRSQQLTEPSAAVASRARPEQSADDPHTAKADLAKAVDAGAAVRVEHVSRRFVDRAGRAVQALRDVSLRAEPDEVLVVVGPSGCGKTTLLEIVCGLQAPDEGEVIAAPAALMPQRDLLLPWLSALDNAALPLRIAGLSRAAARERARPLFDELGLSGFEQARPHQLSGGMRQRVAFLRTLLSGKRVLCLDEPFGALDAITRMQMQSWLADALAQEPRTVVLVTHDVEEAVLLGDRVAVMSARPGRVLSEIEVSLPRPRARGDVQVVQLRERALTALGLEDGARELAPRHENDAIETEARS